MNVSLLVTQALSKPFVSEPITITGYVEAKELGELLPIHLQMKEGHPFAAIMINLYVNSILVEERESVSKYIFTEELYFPSFRFTGQLNDYKISVYYIDAPLLEVSEINFRLVCPCYDDQYVFDNYRYENPYWYRANFTFKGENQHSLTYDTEYVTYYGPRTYNINSIRTIDFSNNLFYVETSKVCDLETCELRIYYKFKDSDLLYKNGYTSIDLNLNYVGNNTFQIDDEYRFYVSKIDGMINESSSENTYDEAMPFYIPVTIEQQTINIEIVFSDVGNIHDNYVFPGIIKITNNLNDDDLVFGSVLYYQYRPVNEFLDVNYE